jgi:hypothetical protein
MTNGTYKLYEKPRISHKYYIYEMRGRAWLTKLFADLPARTSEVNCVGFVVDNASLNTVAYPGILWGGGGGGSTNSVEDRENGDRGAVAP